MVRALTFVLTLLLGVLPIEISGWRSYTSKIPNGDIMGSFGGQGVGHVSVSSGSGARNDFGKAFKSAGKEWTVALCQADSDGDGMTNGYELGDPCCEFTSGSSDWRGKRTTGLTQPGIANTGAEITTTHVCPPQATETNPPTAVDSNGALVANTPTTESSSGSGATSQGTTETQTSNANTATETAAGGANTQAPAAGTAGTSTTSGAMVRGMNIVLIFFGGVMAVVSMGV